MIAAARDRGTRATTVRLAMVLLVLVSLGPLVKYLTAQPGARYALTAALVEEGTVEIDSFVEGTAPIDRVELDGHYYSDKAPLQPFLAAVPFALARAVGAESATHVRIEGNLGLWWVTLWSSVVPAAALVVVMQLVGARLAPRGSVQAALALLFGTFLVVTAAELYGHVMAALAAYGAWALVSDEDDPSPGRLVAVGALAGASVATEYPLLIAVVAVGAFLAWRVRWRVLWTAVGGLPFVAFLAWYQAVAFGSPFAVSYDQKQIGQASDTIAGLPDPQVVVDSLVGSRGLFLWTPLVLVGIVASVAAARAAGDEHRAVRRHGVMALVVVGAFIAMVLTRQTDWPNPIGGEVPSPRYVVPALPFLAAPLAWCWERWRLVATGAAALGLAAMSLPLLTFHVIPGSASVIPYYRAQFEEWGVTPTALTLAVGPAGWVLHLAAIAVAVAWVARSRRSWLDELGPGTPVRPPRTRGAPA